MIKNNKLFCCKIYNLGQTHQDLLNKNLAAFTKIPNVVSQSNDKTIMQLKFGFLSQEKVSYVFKFTGIRLDGNVYTKDITSSIGYSQKATSFNKYVNNGKLPMPVSMLCNAQNAQEQLCMDILTQQKQQIYQNTSTITNWLASANQNNLFDSLSITGNSQNLLTTSSTYLETKQQTSLTTTTTTMTISVPTGDEKNNSEKTTITKTEQKSTDTLSIQTNNANKKQLFLEIKLILLSILFIGFMY